MNKILTTCLYKSRKKGVWNQFFILYVYFDNRKYSFDVKVVRYIFYKNNKPNQKYIQFSKTNNTLIKPIIDEIIKKYGARLKIYKIVSTMELTIKNEYRYLKKTIANILSNKLPNILIETHILNFLY